MSEHRVTAVEPAWVRQEYEPDADGMPEPQQEFETLDLIDSHFEESTYECSCGVEFGGWHEVEAHFDEVTT